MFTSRILPYRYARIALMLLAILLLSACATGPGDRASVPGDAEALYEAGNAALEAGDHAAAIRHFQRLEAQFPNDPHAIQGGMELVFAYYQDGDTSSTVAAAGRFIRAHPDHPNLDYLYYLRMLARYDQAVHDLSVIAGTTGPRPPSVDLALQYSGELIGRYPQSRYSDDARNRVAHLRQQLATFELEAAKQHLNRGEYIPAGLRARSVIEHYPDTGLAADAATVVNMANRMLNLEGAADVSPSQRERTVPLPIPLPVPVPVIEAPPADAPSSDGIGTTQDGTARREGWIARQATDAWTIQLFATGNEQALLNFIERHQLEEAAYFRTTRDNGPWYSLIYGAYDDVDAARAAAERLPRAVLGERPWIRSFSSVQAIITLDGLEHDTGP